MRRTLSRREVLAGCAFTGGVAGLLRFGDGLERDHERPEGGAEEAGDGRVGAEDDAIDEDESVDIPSNEPERDRPNVDEGDDRTEPDEPEDADSSDEGGDDTTEADDRDESGSSENDASADSDDSAGSNGNDDGDGTDSSENDGPGDDRDWSDTEREEPTDDRDDPDDQQADDADDQEPSDADGQEGVDEETGDREEAESNDPGEDGADDPAKDEDRDDSTDDGDEDDDSAADENEDDDTTGDTEDQNDESTGGEHDDTASGEVEDEGDEDDDSATDEDEDRESADDPNALDRAELERLVHDRVNEVRAEHGEGPIAFDEELREVARYHSRDMAENDYFAHTSPDGDDLGDRLERFDVECWQWGENILLTYYETRVRTDGGVEIYTEPEALADAMVQQWMNSEGHRENILRSAWETQGIGVHLADADGRTRVYATQNFC